jgi:hypothetical protein
VKRFFLGLFIFLIGFSFNQAQTKRTAGWVSKFAIAGGVTPMWVMPDFDPVNKMLGQLGLEELPGGGMFAIGGGGYAYIKIVDNLRIGGVGYSGSLTRTITSGGFETEVEYGLGGGALTIEYSLPSVRKIAVSVGAMIGSGSLTIDLYRNDGDFDWDDVWNDLSTGSNNVSRKIENSFFTFSPTVNVDIPFNRFMAFRIGGGYTFTFADDWKIDNNKKLKNVPSDLNGDSFFIQTGIFIGMFLF